MDWQDALKSFREANPDLPEGPGEESVAETGPPEQGRLDIIFERKGRAGKTATIVSGFACDDERLKEVASRLKSTLGTGGSARGGEILIQGDRRSDVLRVLTSMGYKARII